MQTINFGIDLGTTNSLIARFNGKNVDVFKNPVGFKETLPSCVAFRGERIIVGDKAREWLVKDPLNVFSSFKRKMGTGENYFVPSNNTFYSPIELSALVLKELKNFIHTSEVIDSAVITIPASFDTMQSNATKKAGYEAGFKEVVLLQEPIAASLAFFNNANEEETAQNGKHWLVYDLGGGTFDVALVSIKENELKIVDHRGDNFLGGVDFDYSFMMEVMVPKLMAQTGLTELKEELPKQNGPYEKLFFILMLKAEEAKKELSVTSSVEVEFTFTTLSGHEHEVYFKVTDQELNACIAEKVTRSIHLIEEVLHANALLADAVDEIIMIGGSTYIPYVRRMVEEQTGIKTNYSADPTTAVAVGAAYYAASKVKTTPAAPELNLTETVPSTSSTTQFPQIKLAYNKHTKDGEEYITGLCHELQGSYFYRITRADGGYDSGFKPLHAKLGEFVLLRKNTLNTFTFKVYTEQHEEIPNLQQLLDITQGLFSLSGQPLPEDICLEVDDVHNNTTRCELVFERNSILPISKTIYKEVSRTIKAKSDDQLIINVLEGNHKAHPSTNQIIGLIEISGKQLTADLIKGSDIEIKIEVSESRDVSVKANLLLIDYEVAEVFSPSEKYVSVSKLREEIKEMKNEIDVEIMKATQQEDYEKAQELHLILEKLNELYAKAMQLNEKNLSDEKYQLEEYKRKLAQSYFSNDNTSLSVKIKAEYYENRNTINYWVETFDDVPANLKTEFEQLKNNEANAMANTKSSFLVQGQLKALNRLLNKMIFFTPTLLTSYYLHYIHLSSDHFKDPSLTKRFAEMGDKALERKNYEELRGVFNQVLANTHHAVSEVKIKGTGLG